MHRIDGAGYAAGNLFTEGNPALGVPATVVTDDWANDIQEEICNLIEDQSITLVKGTQTQLLAAIKSLITYGGDSQLSQTINNPQGSALDVTSLIFNKTNVKAAHIAVNIERKTDSSNEQESGWLYAYHDSADDTWHLTFNSVGDDCGVVFSITTAGQIQYISDTLSGTNYSGTLRVGQIVLFKQ